MSLGLTGIVFADENTQGSKESSKLLTRGRDRSQTQICLTSVDKLQWLSYVEGPSRPPLIKKNMATG